MVNVTVPSDEPLHLASVFAKEDVTEFTVTTTEAGAEQPPAAVAVTV